MDDYSWITNDPKVAAGLKAVNAQYKKAIKHAKTLPLSDKVLHHRAAKIAKADGYEKVLNACGIQVSRS